MKARSLLRASAAFAATAVTALPAGAFTLHVLHINDFHSRLQSINANDSTCSAEDETAGECFGGAARLHTAINTLRDELMAAGENVIVVDAGDQFQGSLFFTTFSGGAELEFMNGVGFDAMVVGNHEFDLGPEPLLKFVEGAEFPVIFGNADVSGDNRLAALDRDHVIVEVGGERVGILGVVAEDTAETSSPGPGISFGSAADTLAEGIAALEAEGVDKVIALTHVGVPKDLQLSGAVAGLDAIIGGHSHTLFSNTVEGTRPYPVMAPGVDGASVPIVQAGAFSKYLGHLVLEFDDAGQVISATGDTILMDASVEPDPDVLARIAEMSDPIDELMAREVARIEGDIDGSRETCRAQECQMGNLVADAILDRVASQGVTIAIQNGGGLRASIGGPEVTKGEVLTVLPFQNTLATFNLSGAGIVAALENGFSQVEEGAGRFPQVAGLKVVWDPAAEPGSRVAEVSVRDGDGWAPIDPAATYTMASNNFMRKGGDGYAMFSEQGENAYDFGPNLEDVVSDYLAANPGYVPFIDGRITTVR